MPDFTGVVLLLLPLAAATGWYAARRWEAEEQEPTAIDPDYVRGISHLVNDDTDQAIEVFLRLLEADNQTVELHLAMGSLFRRRGEVERALRIHQNLAVRPNLKPVHRNQARYELARDYLKAGVLDRAEDLFTDLANQGMFLQDVLERLARLYEQEREWGKALDTVRWLESARGQGMGSRLAQYHCELAEQARRADDDKRFRQQLKKAQGVDPACVRAHLITASLQRDAGQLKAAIGTYRKIIRQAPEFIPEVLKPMADCVSRESGPEAWEALLEELSESCPGPQAQIALARHRDQYGREALEPLLAYLSRKPSWLGMHAALALPWPELPGEVQLVLQHLRVMLERVVGGSAGYQCRQCGYTSRVLNWQCPSCRQWTTTTPLRDIPTESLVAGARATAVSDMQG